MTVLENVLKCRDVNSLNCLLSENDIKFIDFIFSNFDGQLEKTTYGANIVNECDITNGLDIQLFNKSGCSNQLKLIPIFETAYNDPFSSHSSMGIICETDDEHDSRRLLKSAIKYMNDNSIVDDIHIAVTFEFFVFDDVKYNISNISSSHSVNFSDNKYSSKKFDNYKIHEINNKERNRQLLSNPDDSLYDLRCELHEVLQSFDVKITKHNHGLAYGQCSIDLTVCPILEMADAIQKLKYAIKNVVSAYGKTVTFMAKPLSNEPGSMLSFTSYLIGNNKKIIDHYAENFWKGVKCNALVLSAFANSSINSYKRLYALLNKFTYKEDKGLNKDLFIFDNYNMNVNLADPMVNPYQYFAAFIMAGVDGILNIKDKNIDDIHEELLTDFDSTLSVLENSDFLCKNEVFSHNYIKTYILKKNRLIDEHKRCITTFEYMKYFSY